MPDGRRMRLLKTITFTDAKGKVWTAPKGRIVDGASIPRILWRAVGSPFVGKYRRGSVFHDVACEDRTESYKDVHVMFAEAIACDGVSDAKTMMMYLAVNSQGPKWDENGEDLAPDCSVEDDEFDEWDY